MPLTNSPNHFLASLSPEDRDLVQPHLKPLQLPQGSGLYRADDIIPYVYFPYTGIISLIVGVVSGQYVEACPHHLRYAARIVAVRLVDLRLQHRLHVPRLNADHRQSCFGQSAEQPL